MHTVSDPRHIVTPDAFTVARELLGLPLARPWRRAAAMVLDLALIALLVNIGGVLFGLAAGAALWRISARSTSGAWLRRSWRYALRGVAALVLFFVALSLWGSASRQVRTFTSPEPPPTVREGDKDGDETEEDIEITGVEGIAAAAELLAFRRADTPEGAQKAADRLANRLASLGAEPDEVADVLDELAEDNGNSFARAAARTTALRLRAEHEEVAQQTASPDLATAPADSLAAHYAAALAIPDSARIAELRPLLVQSFAADTAARLERQIERLRDRNRELDQQLDVAAEGPSLLAVIRDIADELGIGIGWAGLYFTAFLAVWHGQTPGKRLFGIRVVRLDGKPMTWWYSFERFGGYAAGFTTGLLGFAQVWWDRNRQGIHDKIAETVVIRG